MSFRNVRLCQNKQSSILNVCLSYLGIAVDCGSGGGSIGGADVGVGHVGNDGSFQTFSKIIYELNQKFNFFLPCFLPCIEMLSVRFFLESIFSAPSVTSKKKQMEFFYF